MFSNKFGIFANSSNLCLQMRKNILIDKLYNTNLLTIPRISCSD